MLQHLDVDCVDAVLDGIDGALEVLFELFKPGHYFVLAVVQGFLDLGLVDLQGGQLFQVVLGVVDDHFQGFDFVRFVLLVVAEAANDALLDALGLDADQVERLANVVPALLTLGVLEAFIG